jgi:hypothetical protein
MGRRWIHARPPVSDLQIVISVLVFVFIFAAMLVILMIVR